MGQFTAQHHTSMPTHPDAVIHQQQQQQQIHQQQSIHPQMRIHGNVNLPPPITTKQLFSKTPDVPQPASSNVAPQSSRQSNSQPPQQHQSKYFLTQQQHVSDGENQTSFNCSFSTNDIQNKPPKASTAMSATVAVTNTHSQVAISPAVASASMAAVAASTFSRHTNSPFAALLAAAAGAPSPSNSSVLRYAESPVAHYLERDNGDFIVQETPKHIVECVEKDNGEFSVIERIYQSPPSVLHIHDDADDDDDDDAGAEEDSKADVATNNQNVEKVSREEKKDCHGKSQLKKVVSSPPSSTKEDNNNQCRNLNKMPIEAKLTNRKSKHTDSSISDNEIVDFVSISSDSDEEEFISHERKDAKNTTDNLKNTVRTTSPIASTSSASRQQHSTLAPSTEAQVAPSSSHANSCNSSVSHQSTTRKKSSKNTITVLSDVQLNLNEYLDLVGNIIASSKVAAQRRTLTSIAPIPLVKIEKEEPMDDYIMNAVESVEQPLPPTPLKANKQETEDLTDNPSNSTSNKPNNTIITDQTQQDRDDKKPQVLENIQENNNNVPPSSHIKNSSQVTSVIRMATTSQHPHQIVNKSIENVPESSSTSNETNKSSAEAEDLSHNLRNTSANVNTTGQSKMLVNSSLGRRAPKKLVIKPKSSKRDSHAVFDDQQPSTSAKALEEYSNIMRVDDGFNINEVQVKNEPITSITFENNQYNNQQAGYSILEQHLTSKEPIMVCKEEKPCIQEHSLSTAIKEMKVENNVNDDARVLYDFANSKKLNTNNKSLTFPSPTSIFAKGDREHTIKNKRNPNEDNHIYSEVETSSYSSQSATEIIHPPEEPTKHAPSNPPLSSDQNGNSQIFPDFPFNYLYNGNNVTEQVDIKNSQQMATLYQNTIASTNNSSNMPLTLEDSSSSKHYSEHNVQQPPGTSSQNQWFNNYKSAAGSNVTSTSSNHSNSNLNTPMSAECSTALDTNEVGKYLDLDECKREQSVEMIAVSVAGTRSAIPPPPSSSTSCSFTENSMAGICSTAGTLNIRTDEKMPAKGEISEQESNCDIDNSWSQPVSRILTSRTLTSKLNYIVDAFSDIRRHIGSIL